MKLCTNTSYYRFQWDAYTRVKQVPHHTACMCACTCVNFFFFLDFRTRIEGRVRHSECNNRQINEYIKRVEREKHLYFIAMSFSYTYILCMYLLQQQWKKKLFHHSCNTSQLNTFNIELNILKGCVCMLMQMAKNQITKTHAYCIC